MIERFESPQARSVRFLPQNRKSTVGATESDRGCSCVALSC